MRYRGRKAATRPHWRTATIGNTRPQMCSGVCHTCFFRRESLRANIFSADYSLTPNRLPIYSQFPTSRLLRSLGLSDQVDVLPTCAFEAGLPVRTCPTNEHVGWNHPSGPPKIAP